MENKISDLERIYKTCLACGAQHYLGTSDEVDDELKPFIGPTVVISGPFVFKCSNCPSKLT